MIFSLHFTRVKDVHRQSSSLARRHRSSRSSPLNNILSTCVHIRISILLLLFLFSPSSSCFVLSSSLPPLRLWDKCTRGFYFSEQPMTQHYQLYKTWSTFFSSSSSPSFFFFHSSGSFFSLLHLTSDLRCLLSPASAAHSFLCNVGETLEIICLLATWNAYAHSKTVTAWHTVSVERAHFLPLLTNCSLSSGYIFTLAFACSLSLFACDTRTVDALLTQECPFTRALSFVLCLSSTRE